MHLFVRTRTCASDRMSEAAAFAVDIATRATGITGIELSAWQITFGEPIGTFSWVATVESHAALASAAEKLSVDTGYLDAVQSADELFVGHAEDSLIQILGTVGDGGHQGGIANTVTARTAAGKIGEVMSWGMEIMEHVAGVTGADGVFTRSMYGPWGTVGWISLVDSFEELDAGNAALEADPEYLAKVDAAADLFLIGSGDERQARRIS